VVAISGYYESEVAIRSVTTGVSRKEPNDYGRWIFMRAVADRLYDPVDIRRLQEIARLRFRDPTADVASLVVALGPEGRAVLALFENRDPNAVGKLIAALPEPIRREMSELNLALHDLSLLRGHLILVHGLNDRLVSHSESQRLARAATRARVSLFLVEGFGHAELKDIRITNAWKMWRVMLELLDQRC
jgi:pimeloyl-ACP methyl ester carboxylesterase